MHDAPWQDKGKTLGLFAGRLKSARKKYRKFVENGISQGRRPDLIGGGLVRSAGGWQAVKMLRKSKVHIKGDERILGDSDFVLDVLKGQDEHLERRYRLQSLGFDLEMVIKRVSSLFSMSRCEIINPSRQAHRVKARSIVCYWAIQELGLKGTEVGTILSLSQPAVCRAVGRGEKLASEMQISLLG